MATSVKFLLLSGSTRAAPFNAKLACELDADLPDHPTPIINAGLDAIAAWRGDLAQRLCK
jgi:hypothetical protein